MKHATRLFLAALLAAYASAAGAQDYPNRLVTIIVPYPAGGPTDQIARELAARLSEKLKQNFVVENVSGGGTTIATGRVARATPDGYTSGLYTIASQSIAPTLYAKLPFDVDKDFTAVAMMWSVPNMLMDVPEKYPGYTHMALAVDDVGAVEAALERAGIRLTGSRGDPAAKAAVFVRDPDGNVIELARVG